MYHPSTKSISHVVYAAKGTFTAVNGSLSLKGSQNDYINHCEELLKSSMQVSLFICKSSIPGTFLEAFLGLTMLYKALKTSLLFSPRSQEVTFVAKTAILRPTKVAGGPLHSRQPTEELLEVTRAQFSAELN